MYHTLFSYSFLFWVKLQFGFSFFLSFFFFDSTSKAEINILCIYLCALMLLIPKDWFPKVCVLSKRKCFILLPNIIITISLKAFSSLYPTHPPAVCGRLFPSPSSPAGNLLLWWLVLHFAAPSPIIKLRICACLLDIFIFSSGNCLYIMHFSIHSFDLLWSRYI